MIFIGARRFGLELGGTTPPGGRRGIRRLGLGLVLAGALGTLGGLAPAASAATTVTCGDTISASGDYALAFSCKGAGITITASEVTLNLNGHRMSAAPGDVAGVAVDSSGGAVSGVRIQGPGEITGYDVGVGFIGAGGVSNSSVSRLTVANNSGGIFFQFGSGNTVSRNTANHNGIGIILQAESGDTVSRNTANDNDQLGIDLILAAHGNTVSGNTANNDGQTGIQVLAHSTGNTISGNAAHNNSVDDLYDGNTGCDTNTWTGNSFKTANQPCIN